ncbi:MAG: ATP-grasp domain-containing protein [Candidatus Omnitrophica bacterium]|nr:ATP-grasp domain-containing protein [Candidatus Omnitrophota bacterium]
MYKHIKKIGIAFNLKKSNTEDDSQEEFDSIETIDALAGEIGKYGFDVVYLEQDGSFCEKAAKEKPELVINLAEGIGSTRGRESQIPCFLESMGIPYSGSDPVSIGITLDKYLTNRFLHIAGVPVPDIYSIAIEQDLLALKGIFDQGKRYILKPRWEGSSKGIFNDSVVSSYEQLCNKAMVIVEKYSQPVVVEEFIRGEEITVGLAGNKKTVSVIGMMKITPVGKKDDKDFIYSLEKKRTWTETIKYHSEKEISEGIKSKVKECAVKAFNALELRDVSRIDFRVGDDIIPKVIDINPLPGLSPVYSDLPILTKLNGGTYSGLINNILTQVFLRYNISTEKLLVKDASNDHKK